MLSSNALVTSTTLQKVPLPSANYGCDVGGAGGLSLVVGETVWQWLHDERDWEHYSLLSSAWAATQTVIRLGFGRSGTRATQDGHRPTISRPTRTVRIFEDLTTSSDSPRWMKPCESCRSTEPIRMPSALSRRCAIATARRSGIGPTTTGSERRPVCTTTLPVRAARRQLPIQGGR